MTGKRRKRGGRRCKRQRLKSGEKGGERRKELIISFTLFFSARPYVKYSDREKESELSCVMLRIVKGGAICSCRMKLR